MVYENSGNILNSRADYIAIPVNLKGVMGAGLAKYFALLYPDGLRKYRMAISGGILRKHTPCIVSEKWMMFPTKDDWREKSSLEDIAKTLENMKAMYPDKTIALPALGCGCGGLDYEEVKKEVYRLFENTPNKIILYRPH